jgi:hypothetical protein
MTPLPPQKTFWMRDFRRNPQRFWATAKARKRSRFAGLKS